MHFSDSWLLVAVVVVTLAVFVGYMWLSRTSASSTTLKDEDVRHIDTLKYDLKRKTEEVERKTEEVNKLRDRVEKLVEIKGRCEAQVKFIAEKDEAVKSTSLAHQASSDKLMKMLDKAQELLAGSRDNTVKKEEKCHKQLEQLRLQMTAVQGNISELVKERHKYYHQSELCYDKLERCNELVDENRAKAAEWRLKYYRCWWC